MKEEQYQALCNACDRILLSPDSTIERVAIPWLHVIREHPAVLTNYVDLFEPANGCRPIIRMWCRNLRNKANWLRQIGRSLCSNMRPWFGPEEFPSGIDVLFVSHFLNPSHAGQEKDFYFDELPNQLCAHGHNVVIALINHTSKAAESLANSWNGSLVSRVILSSSLRLWEEESLHRRLKKESLRLRKLAKREDSRLTRCVLARASEEALSGGALMALRMVSQIGALTAKLHPKAIVVTHEGHAWERMAFAAARSAYPNVRCIGYQHAALFRLQHAIRRNLTPEYNPDQILTAGIVSRDQLQQTHGLKGTTVYVLGSNRTFKGDSINGKNRMHPSQVECSDNLACLVVPEGFASECYLLFEFSVVCAQTCPQIQFIWRLHPLVTFESLISQNHKLRNLPRNIVLSQATLEEDTDRCRWALYRGSTAIIQAVVAGLRPIYLQLPGEMTIDPLYELKGWRTSVKTIEEFHRVIRCDQDRMPKDSEYEFRFAEEYCRDFFTSLNPSALESVIISKRKS